MGEALEQSTARPRSEAAKFWRCVRPSINSSRLAREAREAREALKVLEQSKKKQNKKRTALLRSGGVRVCVTPK